MQRSTDRIRTTHVGSLPRPVALLDLMKAAAQGQQADPAELAETERRAVADVVARQRSAGLDVISDGEQTKTGFFASIGQRLGGFSSQATYRPEIHPTIVWPSSRQWPRERAAPPPACGDGAGSRLRAWTRFR
jgi:methionine synthase II (cobalamin-independent)